MTRRCAQWLLAIPVTLMLAGCGSVMSKMTSQMAGNLGATIQDSTDIDTVEQAMPAYLLLIDSFVRSHPDDPELLMSAAQLNSAYSLFTTGDRTRSLMAKALGYGVRAACVSIKASCNMRNMPFDAYKKMVDGLKRKDVPVMYTVGVAWAGWIQANSGDWNAIAKLGRVKYLMARLIQLDETYDHGGPQLYMGGLASTLPAAMGGHPEEAKKHFERAIQISGGKYLMDKVIYAEQYARLTFNKKLYVRLLKEVLAANPVVPGMTLANEVAQRQARKMLAHVDDYF